MKWITLIIIGILSYQILDKELSVRHLQGQLSELESTIKTIELKKCPEIIPQICVPKLIELPCRVEDCPYCPKQEECETCKSWFEMCIDE
jgi:hypothetical protein